MSKSKARQEPRKPPTIADMTPEEFLDLSLEAVHDDAFRQGAQLEAEQRLADERDKVAMFSAVLRMAERNTPRT